MSGKVPPLNIEKLLISQKIQDSEPKTQDIFDLKKDFEVQEDDPMGDLQDDHLSPEKGLNRSKFKSPSLVIQTNLDDFDDDDFDDGRIPTEVHYESDSAEICEVKVDLISDNIEKRPLSARKQRPRRVETNLRVSKQGSGSIGKTPGTAAFNKRVRGMTPPQLKRGMQRNNSHQPFMSTTNKRALEVKAKVNEKFEGAFFKSNKKQKKKRSKKKL